MGPIKNDTLLLRALANLHIYTAVCKHTKTYLSMPIQSIIFDLGNVLLDLDFAILKRQFQALVGPHFDIEQQLRNHEGLFLDFELGLISEEAFFFKLQAEVKGDISTEQLKVVWNSLLLEVPKNRIQLLERFREKYPLYLLSNTNFTHIQWLNFHLQDTHQSNLDAFEALFQQVFYSFKMHKRKPKLDIFKAVLEEAQLDPVTTLFIDDSEVNVKAAREVGIQAVFHDPKNEIERMLPTYLERYG